MIYKQVLKRALPRILLVLCVLSTASLAAGRQDNHKDDHKDDQEVPRMTVADLMARLEKHTPIVIVDSRSEGSWEGTDKQIKGSIRIPIDQIEPRMSELPKDKEIVIYCS